MSDQTNAAQASDNNAVAALLAEDSRFAWRLGNAEKAIEPEARQTRFAIAVKTCPDACRKYVALGGPLSAELSQHLPANDSAPGETQSAEANAKAVADMGKATQTPGGITSTGTCISPPRVALGKGAAERIATNELAAKKAAKAEQAEAAKSEEREPDKWEKPEPPKGYVIAPLKSVADAQEWIAKHGKSGNAGSQIAWSIGWAKIPKRFSDADVDMLADELADKMGVKPATVKKTINKGVWKHSAKHKAWEDARERNAPRGDGFEFLVGTDFTLNDDQTMIGVVERSIESSKFFPVCTAFNVLGKIRDENSGSWGLRIVFEDFEGKTHSATVSNADIHGDTRALRSSLADEGFQIVPYGRNSSRPGLERLFSDIMPRVENTLTIYSRPGWHDSRFLSVLGEVVGEDADSAVLSDRTGAEDREKKGTLEGWKSAANELAGDNDHWSIGVAAGFAGILIDRCGLDTAAACISGPTSDGKTIALTLSASVHGNPKERAGVLHPLRVTSNSIESLFERASGATISLDELALAEPRDVGAMLMLLASGSGKARMTKTTALGRMARWRGFVLFSSERSLRNIVEGAKGQYLGGHAVRCVDIATTGARRHDPAAVRALGQKLKDNYGHAAPIFADHLLAMGEAGEPGKLRERIAAAAKTFAGEKASPAQARAAHTFAVLAVAASIAEKAALIDDAGAVTDALLRAWARYAAGDELRAADPVKEALSTLRDNLTTLRNHTLLALDDKRSKEGLKVMVKGKITTIADPDDEEEATEAPRFREPVGFYDKTHFYIRADKLVGLAGGVVKLDDLKKGLGAYLVRRGKKHLTWQELPGKDPLSHYRLKVAFAVAEADPDEED